MASWAQATAQRSSLSYVRRTWSLPWHAVVSGEKIVGLNFLIFPPLFNNPSVFWRLWVYFGKREGKNNPGLENWYSCNFFFLILKSHSVHMSRISFKVKLFIFKIIYVHTWNHNFEIIYKQQEVLFKWSKVNQFLGLSVPFLLMNPLKSVGYKGAVIRYCQRQGIFSLDADGF